MVKHFGKFWNLGNDKRVRRCWIYFENWVFMRYEMIEFFKVCELDLIKMSVKMNAL